MPALFRNSPIEVDNRLEDLGWAREELLEVVAAMVAARNGCTENDPNGAPGWMAYKDGTRRMREIGLPKGMHKSDDDQIPWVLDTKRGIRFAVSNTDDGTGDEHAIPQNRSKKGPATDRAVGRNQGWLFDELELADNVVPLSMARRRQPGIIVSWYLCVYVEGDEVRAELSCPTAVESGFFTNFMERLVLVGRGGGDLVRRRGDDPAPQEFDIPVSKK